MQHPDKLIFRLTVLDLRQKYLLPLLPVVARQ
jgi:hypothetical protein